MEKPCVCVFPAAWDCGKEYIYRYKFLMLRVREGGSFEAACEEV